MNWRWMGEEAGASLTMRISVQHPKYQNAYVKKDAANKNDTLT